MEGISESLEEVEDKVEKVYKPGDICETDRDLEVETNGKFLQCDGRYITKDEYPELFSVIKQKYGITTDLTEVQYSGTSYMPMHHFCSAAYTLDKSKIVVFSSFNPGNNNMSFGATQFNAENFSIINVLQSSSVGLTMNTKMNVYVLNSTYMYVASCRTDGSGNTLYGNLTLIRYNVVDNTAQYVTSITSYNSSDYTNHSGRGACNISPPIFQVKDNKLYIAAIFFTYGPNYNSSDATWQCHGYKLNICVDLESGASTTFYNKLFTYQGDDVGYGSATYSSGTSLPLLFYMYKDRFVISSVPSSKITGDGKYYAGTIDNLFSNTISNIFSTLPEWHKDFIRNLKPYRNGVFASNSPNREYAIILYTDEHYGKPYVFIMHDDHIETYKVFSIGETLTNLNTDNTSMAYIDDTGYNFIAYSSSNNAVWNIAFRDFSGYRVSSSVQHLSTYLPYGNMFIYDVYTNSNNKYNFVKMNENRVRIYQYKMNDINTPLKFVRALP